MTKRDKTLTDVSELKPSWLDDPRNKDIFYEIINRHRNAAASRSIHAKKRPKRPRGSAGASLATPPEGR